MYETRKQESKNFKREPNIKDLMQLVLFGVIALPLAVYEIYRENREGVYDARHERI